MRSPIAGHASGGTPRLRSAVQISPAQRGTGLPLVRIIAVVDDATVNDLRQVDEVPRLADALDVDGQTMRVRSVSRAEPGAGIDAFVYATPAADADSRARRSPGSRPTP